MKKGKNSNFFNGRLKKSIRVYRYDPEVRQRLFETQERSERTIILTGCWVKTGRNGHDLEVFVNKQTNIEKSSKQFSVPKEDQALEKHQSIVQLSWMSIPKSLWRPRLSPNKNLALSRANNSEFKNDLSITHELSITNPVLPWTSYNQFCYLYPYLLDLIFIQRFH